MLRSTSISVKFVRVRLVIVKRMFNLKFSNCHQNAKHIGKGMFKIIHNIAVNIQMTLTTHQTVRTDSPITSMRKLLKLKHWSFAKFYNSIFFTKPII